MCDFTYKSKWSKLSLFGYLKFFWLKMFKVWSGFELKESVDCHEIMKSPSKFVILYRRWLGTVVYNLDQLICYYLVMWAICSTWQVPFRAKSSVFFNSISRCSYIAHLIHWYRTLTKICIAIKPMKMVKAAVKLIETYYN